MANASFWQLLATLKTFKTQFLTILATSSKILALCIKTFGQSTKKIWVGPSKKRLAVWTNSPPPPNRGRKLLGWAGLLRAKIRARCSSPHPQSLQNPKKKAVVCHTFHTLNVAHPPPPCIHVPDMAHTSLQTSSILEIKLEPAQKKKRRTCPKKERGRGKSPFQIKSTSTQFHTAHKHRGKWGGTALGRALSATGDGCPAQGRTTTSPWSPLLPEPKRCGTGGKKRRQKRGRDGKRTPQNERAAQNSIFGANGV